MKKVKTLGSMAKIKPLFASLVILLLTWGCLEDVLKETYILTLNVVPEAAGFAEEGGTFEVGETVNLTATANTGFQFASWTEGDGCASAESIFNYEMPAHDVSLTANFFVPGGGVTDIDGNIYPTAIIGDQEWMADNLKTTRFNDGTPIHIETDNNTWVVLDSPAFCWFKNDEEGHKTAYGALYNWFVTDVDSNGNKNVCPTGWHIPTDAEWSALLLFLDPNADPGNLQESLVAGRMLKQAGTTYWNATNTSGLNTTGFTAMPGGFRGTGGTFVQLGTEGKYWSSTGHDYYNVSAWYRSMQASTPRVARHHLGKRLGFSIRCLKD